MALAAHPEADLGVRISLMRRRHLRAVMRIEAQVYPRPWTLGVFLSELAQRESRVYMVARSGHAVVGYAGLLLQLDDGHVTTIAVDPSAHRRRVGTRMLLTLARAALRRGARNLTLEVRVSNAPAQALYRTFGFAPAGIRKGYYAETGEDALVMWATDVDQPEYARRLAEIESTLTSPTVVEGGWL